MMLALRRIAGGVRAQLHRTRADRPGWFHAYGTRLRAGRDFDATDRAGGGDVAIVNDAFARRYFEGKAPLGHTLVEAIGPNERPALSASTPAIR